MVGDFPGDRQILSLAGSPDFDSRRLANGKPSHQVERERGSFDGGPGNPEAVGEIPHRPDNGAPLSSHRPARNPGRFPVGGVLVDYQIERHDLGQQLGEVPPQVARCVGEIGR